MEPGELMIGNYINVDKHFIELGMVCGIETDKIYYQIKDYQCGEYNEYDHADIEDCIPIKLTEQWLIELSKDVEINKLDDDVTIAIDRFYLQWNVIYNFWYVYDKESLTYITKVEFVHEWQNVFFVLNGEKLTK